MPAALMPRTLACVIVLLLLTGTAGGGARAQHGGMNVDEREFLEARGGAFSFRLVDITDLLRHARYMKCADCDTDSSVSICRPPHAMSSYQDIVVVKSSADIAMSFVDADGLEIKRAELESVSEGYYGLEIRSNWDAEAKVTGWRLSVSGCTLKEKPRTWLRF